MVHLMPLPSQNPLLKSRLVLPFWYWLTQDVLEKRPLNGCSSVVMLHNTCSNTAHLCNACDVSLTANLHVVSVSENEDVVVVLERQNQKLQSLPTVFDLISVHTTSPSTTFRLELARISCH